MKPKKAVWLFFGFVAGIQIAFRLSPLQFKYSPYSFEINAVVIVLFSVFLAFVFKKLWVRIVAPILTLVVSGGAWTLFLFANAFGCGDYNVSSYDIDKYVIRKGVIGCWAGPSTHSFTQLERKVVSDLITYTLERSEVRNSERIYDDPPRFHCDITFEESKLSFDICERKLKGDDKPVFADPS